MSETRDFLLDVDRVVVRPLAGLDPPAARPVVERAVTLASAPLEAVDFAPVYFLGVAEADEVADALRVAAVLGAEGHGLEAETMAASTHRVRISISASVDSLNVGHAAAITFAVIGRPGRARQPDPGAWPSSPTDPAHQPKC